MKLATAEVISNEQVLKELERCGACTSKRPEARNTSGSWLIWLNCPEIATEARPGQFVMVRCGDDCYLPRPFSIYQVDGEKLALLFNIVGEGTDWLAERKPRDTVDIFGPLGNGFTISIGSKNLLLVYGGMGIAPLQFLADRALSCGYLVGHLKGAATASQLFEIRPGAAMPYGTILTGEPATAAQYYTPASPQPNSTTEDGSAGIKGVVVDLLTNEVIDWADQIFACGPVGMYRAMAQMPELKNKAVQVSLEIVMGCGVGVCYGCTIRTKNGLKQVCKDGPVFELSDLDTTTWDELVL